MADRLATVASSSDARRLSGRRMQGTDDHLAHEPRPAYQRESGEHASTPSDQPAPITPPPPAAPASARAPRELGQVLPIFVIMSVVLLGGAALLTDVAWWWTFEQRMQRAADAGALAGAIYLPGNQALAFSTRHRRGGQERLRQRHRAACVVTPRRDPDRPAQAHRRHRRPGRHQLRQGLLLARRTLPRARVDVGVTGAASYVLPVPMGSPQNYYGVGFFQGVIPGTTTTTPGSTGWLRPTAARTASWTNPRTPTSPTRTPGPLRDASHEHRATTRPPCRPTAASGCRSPPAPP